MGPWIAFAGDNLRHIANAIDDVERAPSFRDVIAPNMLSGRKRIEPARVPASFCTFTWRWNFADTSARSEPPSRPGGGGPVETDGAELVKMLPRQRELDPFTRTMQEFAERTGFSLAACDRCTGPASKHGLARVRLEYEFEASLWQFMQLINFVESHRHFFDVRGFHVQGGESPVPGVDAVHSVRMTIETFVCESDVHLDSLFPARETAATRKHPKPYVYSGRKGRWDILVDPRPTR